MRVQRTAVAYLRSSLRGSKVEKALQWVEPKRSVSKEQNGWGLLMAAFSNASNRSC